MATKGDICFYKNKLLSVADDCVLKTYNVSKGDLQLEHQVELSSTGYKGEPTTIATNGVDKLVLSGSNK